MRNAPSVEHPVGRSVFERKLHAAFALMWLFMQSLWAIHLGLVVPPGAWWVSFLCGVAAAAYGGWRLKLQPVGVLRWNAAAQPKERWDWLGRAGFRGTALKQVDCMLDLQVVVLLRLVTHTDLPMWVWLERGQTTPTQWDALRRAIKAHGRADLNPGLPFQR